MTSETIMTTPAENADRLCRLAREIMADLMATVFRSEELAYPVAHKIAQGIIDRYGGGSIYVPSANRRAGLKDHEAIASDIRAAVDGGKLGRAAANQIAERHGVSRATVWRVFSQTRCSHAPVA